MKTVPPCAVKPLATFKRRTNKHRPIDQWVLDIAAPFCPIRPYWGFGERVQAALSELLRLPVYCRVVVSHSIYEFTVGVTREVLDQIMREDYEKVTGLKVQGVTARIGGCSGASST